MGHDLVIRGGTIVDGSGGPTMIADVAVSDGKITAIGQVAGSGIEEIDARDRLVTPGFIDMHTHYDGQATWDEFMQPSSWHGVTTVVGGNCGVGFAPCREADHGKLIRLMEGVEDIPEAVMADGLPWTWESFPDYLDFLGQRRFDIDVGVQIPHSPVRVYVMGERGANREPATADEIAQMRSIVADGVRAGAIGVSTSRFLLHRTRAGEIAPSVESAEAELLGLAGGLRDAGGGVFQIIPSLDDGADPEFALMTRLAEAAGRPLSFSLVAQQNRPDIWRRYLDLLDQYRGAAPIKGQVFPRPIGILFGLDLSFHPFSLNASYRPLEALPLAEKVAALRDPELRRRILSESPEDPNPFLLKVVDAARDLYLFEDPPVYKPSPQTEASAVASRRDMSRHEVIYDWLLEDDGHAILYSPGANFVDRSLDAVAELMHHPGTVLGLGDGGAHYGMICDASFPTSVMAYWARDAEPSQRIAVAKAVNMLTAAPAAALGLTDRGHLAVGMRADINVIDHPRVQLRQPHAVRDLPAGGRRLRQRADGYDATIVNGQITYRFGEATGALPGRLLRGAAGAKG
ncbi:MAG: amidohydrolase family protein [Sphingobium sp.]